MRDGNKLNLSKRIARNLPEIRQEREIMKEECQKAVLSGDSQQKKTGDFSTTTKIARHGGKSSYTIANMHEEITQMVPEFFDATEHSFVKGGANETQMPVFYSLKRPRAKASEDEIELFKRTIDKEKRVLGVYFRTCGDSAGTGERTIRKARLKIKEVPLPGGGPKCAAIMSNTYITPSLEWALVLCKINLDKLNGLDRDLIKKLRHHMGLTKGDCAINVMRAIKNYGSGCKGFMDTYIIGLAQEMEELLSNPGDAGIATRSSLALMAEFSGSKDHLYE